MTQTYSQRVVILGASANPARMSYQAVKQLRDAGHDILPVHPAVTSLLGSPVLTDVMEVRGEVDTLTMYVNADRSSAMQEALLELKPKRVIFNPGAENPDLKRAFEDAGIPCVEACTLVMLRNGRF